MRKTYLLSVISLGVLSACGGSGSGQASSDSPTVEEAPVVAEPSPDPSTPLPTPTFSPMAPPLPTPTPTFSPTATPLPTPTPTNDLGSFNGEPISDIIAEGRASHPYWADYWSFSAANESSLVTQYAIDRAWEEGGGTAFKPRPFPCKEAYQSPFEVDPSAPSIELQGNKVVDHLLGSLYEDAGVIALDNEGNDIASDVLVEGLEYLDINQEGNYLITYQVTDANNMTSRPVGRMVRVYAESPRIEHIYHTGESHSPLSYYGFTPQNYGQEDVKHPVIIFFHGWGASADFGQIENVLLGGAAYVARHNGTRLWDQGPDFLVFQPQRSVVLNSDLLNRSYNDPAMPMGCETREFVDHILANYSVDESQIYFIGFSNGVLALLEYLRTFDDRAAAAVLIAGAGWLHDICDHPQIPYWSIIGSDDEVGFNLGQNIPLAMNRITAEQNGCPGENPVSKFTVVPGIGHLSVPFLDNSQVGNWQAGDGQSPFDQTVWEWLLEHQNNGG